jgi:O-antigen ligase
MVNYDGPLDKIYQYLFIAAFFLLPLTVVGNNIAIWLAVLLWLFSGNYLSKLKQIYANKLALASIFFFCLHPLSILWSDDIAWGLEISRKMLPFLFVLPVFLTLTRRENAKFYIGAFLLAIAITEVFSYLVWFEIIEPFKNATVANPTPFMGHISYNPFIAFAIYLVVNRILAGEKLPLFERATYTFFILTMTVNMFITGGRAGQVMFLASIIILAFQYFRNAQVKATIISLLLIFCIVVLAHNTSDLFAQRVADGLSDILSYETNKATAIGQRITFFLNSLELVKSSPLIGIGVGDFPYEYQKVNDIFSPEVPATVQPHNMYMLVLAQLGILGLLSFVCIFLIQFKIALACANKIISNIGVALPLLFLVIMWSDSYLLGHFTGNLFILFSAFIYSNQ